MLTVQLLLKFIVTYILKKQRLELRSSLVSIFVRVPGSNFSLIPAIFTNIFRCFLLSSESKILG